VLYLITGICTAMALASPFLTKQPLPLIAIYGAVAASCIAAHRLARAGHPGRAAAGFVVVGWLAQTVSVFLLGGVSSPSFSASVSLVLLAGLIWNERAALAFGALSVGAATVFAFLPPAWLPSPLVEPARWRFLAALLAQIVVVLLSLRLATTSVRRNLARAQESSQVAREATRAAERRVRQQTAIARLGTFALASRDSGALLDEFVNEVSRTLGAELVKVLELSDDGGHLLLRAGLGWDAGLVGQARVPVGKDSQAGFTIASQIPVLVSDLSTEQRFSGPELLTNHGVRSGVSVVIRVEGRTYGILAAHSRQPDAFRDEDALFLQTAANLLSTALGRERLEANLARQGRLEALGRLAGGVAHDFNNLLTVILGYADALGQRGTRIDPALAAKEIRGAAERAAGLTRDLLAFARQVPGLPITLDLNEIVARSLRLLERLVGEDIRLRTQFAAEPCLVRADAGQIERVLVNLVINARDAQPDGGEIAIATRRCTEGARASVRLIVTDRGSGMAPHVLAHAFEPFFTTKGGGAGSGLGLATVYGVVQQLGGEVSATSELGAGTQITIDLPLATEARRELEGDAPAEASAVRAGTGETVLAVEDAPELRVLLVESLERAGYVVLAAADGLAAISLIESHPGPIDALITDIVMPGASGFDVAARVRERRPNARVLYMSGYVGHDGSLAEVERPDVTFVANPFRMRDLTAALGKTLARGAPVSASPARGV